LIVTIGPSRKGPDTPVLRYAGKNVIVYIEGREEGILPLAGRNNPGDFKPEMKDETTTPVEAESAGHTRQFDTANTRQPQIAILGAEPFTTLVTNSGAGQTRFGSLAVTRWRADPTLDDSGQWHYVRDLTALHMWSAGFQPSCVEADWYKVSFAEDCATFHRRDGEIETMMEIAVSSADATEIRRITLTNHSTRARDIELTSCSEVVLASFAIDRGHPAFSNLFVQTQWIPAHSTVLAMRRPRSTMNDPLWCGHTLSVIAGKSGEASCETDRAQFIGRGRSYRSPLAMTRDGPLSNRAGAVLDPVFALRIRLSIHAGESASAAFSTFMAKDRVDAVARATRLSRGEDVSVMFANSRNHPPEMNCEVYQDLAGQLLFPGPSPIESSGSRNELSDLGITGERPVLLCENADDRNPARLNDVIRMHRYWMAKGIAADVVILCTSGIEAVRSAIPDEDISTSFFLIDASSIDDKHRSALISHARLRLDLRR
jgi:cyclic beta-1,2-glucan synthetase